MKRTLPLAIALVLVSCGQSVEDSRTVVENLDPNMMADQVEREVEQQAQQAINAEFECIVGESRCAIDGLVYMCGFDGEQYGYYDTGAECDNLDLLEFDRRARHELVYREFGYVAPWVINLDDHDDTDPAPPGSSGGQSDPSSNGGSGSSGGSGSNGSGGSGSGSGGDFGGASGGQGGSSGGGGGPQGL